MSLTLGFYGGAGSVTGSRFLLRSGSRSLLVDCGMFQGLKELRLRNWAGPGFDPREVEAVVVTHAHIDHTGYLPRLVREGFRGPIYSTPATADLAEILLLDAARLQEEDADYANRKSFSKHHPALPLFDTGDARAALSQFREVDYGVPFETAGMRVQFHNAGHILGSAFAEVVTPLAEGGETTTVFSGDLGRYEAPLHIDPEPLPACDTLLLESTYGDRAHTHAPLADQLASQLRPALARGGTVLIPAFAVARAQLVTLVLRDLMESGALPETPVHIDSPMAVDVTQIYGRYLRTGDLDEGLGRGLRLFPERVQFHRSVEDSRRLNGLPGPRIIVSSSGMLTGGRVLHHLRRLAGDRRNLILITGYQAVGTRGRALVDGVRELKMHGEMVRVNAQVAVVDGFSAHADRNELVRWVKGAASLPSTLFLVHGEPGAVAALEPELAAPATAIQRPRYGDEFEYVPGSRRWRSTAAP